MRKKFGVNLLFLFAANLLVKPFWIFGIDRVVQNKVGAEVYGTFFAVYNYSFLLSIILDFGINNFNNRAVSRSNNRASEYVFNLLFIKFSLALLYFIFTFVTAILTGYSELQMKMLLFLAVNQILLSVILYFRSNIAALQLFKIDSFISVLDRLLVILFCLVLLYSSAFKDSFNIMWFIYAQTVAYFITAFVGFAVVFRKTLLKFDIWKLRFTKLVLVKSMPFALLALLMGIYSRIDAVMLERMLPNGAHEAGIYAASYRLLDALNQFGVLFATLLLPMFSAMIRRRESTTRLVKFGAELLFVLSVIAGVSSYSFRNEIMQLLYHNSNTYWAQIFGLLMLNFIPISSIYVFGTLLTANGSMKLLNGIALAGVIINVSLNFFLIPAKGALGAAIATLITQSAVAVAHILTAEREIKLHYHLSEAIKLGLFVIICILILFSIQLLDFDWMMSFGFSLLACSALAFLMKLVPLREVIMLFKSKVTS